nr:unnamed protein product [Spirometra erinaceieuropaei]
MSPKRNHDISYIIYKWGDGTTVLKNPTGQHRQNAQFIRRVFYYKIPLQGNIYPMTCAAYIEDAHHRVTLLSAQSLGFMAGEHPGEMNVWLDRRVAQGDGRGLGEGVLDNVPTRSVFRIIVETVSPAAPADASGSNVRSEFPLPGLTQEAQWALADLIYPTSQFVFSTTTATTRTGLIEKMRTNLLLMRPDGLPPDHELVALKTFYSTSEHFTPDLHSTPGSQLGILLHRTMPYCGRTYLCEQCSVSLANSSSPSTSDKHGFRKGRSCVTNLLYCLEHWTRAVDRGDMVHAIYIDFKKAFDSVPHHRLLYKLSRAGVRGKLLMWIRSFLIGRSQAVHVGDQQSAEVAVKSGVLQGSVLGPTLFLVYVNDCTNELNCDVAMFADDLKIWSTIRSEVDEARLQTNLDHLEQWSKDWLIPFNVNKCTFLRVGRTSFPNHTVYRLTGKPLQEVDAQKDLGVWITISLKPSLQCSKVAKSAMSMLYLVKRAFSSFDEDCFAKLTLRILGSLKKPGFVSSVDLDQFNDNFLNSIKQK